MAGPAALITIDRSSARRCRAGCQGQTPRSSAPAATDRLAPARCARAPAARQRLLPDAEIVGGEVSFLTSLYFTFIRSPRRRGRAEAYPQIFWLPPDPRTYLFSYTLHRTSPPSRSSQENSWPASASSISANTTPSRSPS